MPTRFRFEHKIAAPIQVVWDLLSDHEGYKEWSPLPTSRLVREGADDPNGVGAVRHFGVGRAGTREEVVAFDPPHHLAYSVIKGFPVRNHRADIRLEDLDGDTTRLVYEGSGEATVPLTGPLVGLVLSTAVRRLLAGVIRRAEKIATPDPR